MSKTNWKDEWVKLPPHFDITKVPKIYDFDYDQYLHGKYAVFTKGNNNLGTGPNNCFEQVEIWCGPTDSTIENWEGTLDPDNDYCIYGKLQYNQTPFDDSDDFDDDDRDDVNQWTFSGKFFHNSLKNDVLQKFEDESYTCSNDAYNTAKQFGIDGLNLIMIKISDLKPEIYHPTKIVFGPDKRFYNLYYKKSTKELTFSSPKGSDDIQKLVSASTNQDSSSDFEFVATIDICELASIKERMIAMGLFTIVENNS